MRQIKSDGAWREVEAQWKNDRVVAFPTDTFYGLGVNATSPAALHALTRLKGRKDEKPYPVLLAEPQALLQYVKKIPLHAERAIHRYWPGALTVVLPCHDLPDSLTNANGAVGFRVPNHALLRDLLIRWKGPITGTSANLSGNPPARVANEVAMVFKSEDLLIVDGGETPGGAASTVVDFTSQPKLIREGAIPWIEIQQTMEES